jgi:hypothetical protein
VTNLSGSGNAAHVALPHVHIVASLLKRLGDPAMFRVNVFRKPPAGLFEDSTTPGLSSE